MTRNPGIDDSFIPRANIVKCASRLGAEIVNVRLSAEPPQDVLCAIRQLVCDHKVLFFRDQTHLDEVQHERLVTVLAKLGQQPPLGRPPAPSPIIPRPVSASLPSPTSEAASSDCKEIPAKSSLICCSPISLHQKMRFDGAGGSET